MLRGDWDDDFGRNNMTDSSALATILVVGGAGYIGSHMVRTLAEQGYRVIVFDNLSTGHRDAVTAAEFIEGDLLRPGDLQQVFGTYSIDAVMHFAALCYVGESVKAPRDYYQNNVTGTLNLLDAMLDADVKRLVFSSTCATYGNPVAIPMTEEHPQAPVNPYGWSKLMIEQVMADYAVAYGVDSIALRYFNAAGCDAAGRLGERHNPETHLIPLVLREALRVRNGGDPADTALVAFGDDFPTADGTCVRDYIHVDDLCTAHLAALRRLGSEPGKGFEAFNLGNGTGFSVREVIEVAREVTGIDIRYRIGPRRPGDPPELVGSATKARTHLGWEPQIILLQNIVKTAWEWQNSTSTSSRRPSSPFPGVPVFQR
jgi:UDP-glucose-4-epimerase GalE